MMFRRNSNTPEEQALLEARRRLRLAAVGGGTEGAGVVASGQHDQQIQQQLHFFREQQILREARAVALAGQHQQQQLFSTFGFPPSSTGPTAASTSGLPSLQQQLEHQQQLQQLLHHSSPSILGGVNIGGDQDPLLQRAHLEGHSHAQAQAEARMKALLAEHEVQVVQDQLRFHSLRHRQQPASSPSAYEVLSNGAGRSLNPEAPNLSAARWFQQQQASGNTGQQMARMLGLGGSQPQAPAQQGTSLLQAGMNMNATPGVVGQGVMAQNTSVILSPSLRDEAMAFGKIARQTSDGGVVDMALQIQSRRNHKTKTEREFGDYIDNSKQDDDHQSDAQGSETDLTNAKVEDGDSQAPDEGNEEDQLDDDEYFRRNKPRDSKDKDRGTDTKTNDSPSSYPMTREAFPLKLYRILYEAKQNGQDDIISFFPHGRAFAVHKAREFTRDIMPKYFPAGRMNTFLKQLNLYGFRRITEGRDKGGYFHKDFLNGKRHACKKIKRKKVHVSNAPLPTPTAMSRPSLGGIGAASASLPFLDQLSAFGATSGYLSQQHQQLLQQQQQVLHQHRQQLHTGLELTSVAGPGATLMLGTTNSRLDRERLLRGAASASADGLAQSYYIQELSPPGPANTASRLHPANFRNFNPANNSNPYMR